VPPVTILDYVAGGARPRRVVGGALYQRAQRFARATDDRDSFNQCGVCVDMGAGLWGWMYGFMFREEGYVMVWCCAGHMCVQGWQLWLFGVGQMQYTG